MALVGVGFVELAAGECVVLYGRSGSGKTTLLNLVGGIDRPDAGRIEVDGVPLGDLDLDLTKDVKDLTLEVETSKGTCTTTNVGQVTYEEIADIGTFQGCTRTGTSSYAWIQLQIFSQ